MSWYAEALSFPFTGNKGPRLNPGKQPHVYAQRSSALYPSSTELAVGQVMFSWYQQNPDSLIRLPNREVWFLTLQNRFPLLQCPVVVCFTLYPTLSIVLDDVRIACSCSPMDIHSIKLLSQSVSADINTSGSLDLFSYGISRVLATCIHHAPQ